MPFMMTLVSVINHVLFILVLILNRPWELLTIFPISSFIVFSRSQLEEDFIRYRLGQSLSKI